MACEEDQDVFEISDYTTASDWERFICNIEEIIHEWKLNHVKLRSKLKMVDVVNGKWKEQSDSIVFSGFRFVMSYKYLQVNDEGTVGDANDEEPPQPIKDIMNSEIDFSTSHESLNYWYGLREYLIISPAVGENAIANESRAKLLLSSICIALYNTGCQIPMFIQMHQKADEFYLGLLEGRGLRTHFQMVNLRRFHPNFSHLAGLIDIFKSKLACQIQSAICVSMCFTYNLQGWDYYGQWPQSPPSVDDQVGNLELGQLPFGTWVDPINEIQLSAIWSNIAEDMIIDNGMHFNLDPMYATQWRAKLNFVDEIPCLLATCLSEFRNLINYNEINDPLLSFKIRDSGVENDVPIAQALDRLTNKVPPLINIPTPNLKPIRNSLLPEGPIPEEKLKEILFFLFPDAAGTKCEEQKSSPLENERYKHIYASLKSIKSVPSNSLVYLLAICISHVNHSYGRIAAIVHLWHEFVLEMRHRWENNLSIPGVEPGSPDISTCLLSQKLQMLNYCIEKKRLRDQQQTQVLEESDNFDDKSSDDEFFDCDEEKQKVFASEKCSQQPEGRLRPCGNLKIIGSEEIVYIPITQDPPPMTEDQLEAHADVLLKLGADEEGSELRARMQSSCLLSDMQSFKAANPNCKLEDFVRWYSPRDWIEEESGEGGNEETTKGRLSDRMLVPDNMWQRVWLSAKAIPARRQRRLFDDTKEGEKVLHYLTSLTPAGLARELMPVLIHAAIDTLVANDDGSHMILPSALQSVISTTAKLSRLTIENTNQYDDVIRNLKTIETMLSQSQAFHRLFTKACELIDLKIGDINAFTKELFENQVVYLPGGVNTKAGKVLHRLLKDSQKVEKEGQIFEMDNVSRSEFPSPLRKEYILRTVVNRPVIYSSPTPQRMYCSLSEEGFRLAGVFTCDTTFQ